MTVQVDMEGYAAEKHLMELNKMNKNKLRAERKRKRQERLVILSKIEQLKNEVCENCKNLPARNVAADMLCDCPASTEMRKLGCKLGWEQGKPGRPSAKAKTIENFKHINSTNFSPEIYLDMKYAGMTDREIMALLGWSNNRYYGWKRENGLIVNGT